MIDTLKLRELERRIKSLELKSGQTDFNYVRYEASGGSGQSQAFTYGFQTLKKCVLKLKFIVYAQYAPGKSGSIKINGVKVKDFLPKTGKTEIECFVPFEKGNQGAALYLTSDAEFTVNSCVFEVFGCVDYPESDSTLSVINESDRSVILFAADGRAALIDYAGSLSEKFSCEATAAAVFNYSDGYVLACANNSGELTARFITSDYTVSDPVTLVSRGVISVCAFGGESPCLFAVKGSRVIKLTFNESDLSFSESQTEYRGKKVVSNPAVSDCFILTDFDGNNKLVAL